LKPDGESQHARTRGWFRYGSPALVLLLRLKLRGVARRQWRRLRSPKGLVLTLLGALLLAAWLGYLGVSVARGQAEIGAEAAELRVRGFALLLLTLSLSGALANRGLYLPKTEIERLFSAPVSRADLVRYRLLANGLRSLLGGLVLALVGAARMPSAPLAFAGILLAMQTLPVVNQLAAITLGGLELRSGRWLRRAGSFLFLAVVGVFMTLLFALTTERPVGSIPLVGPWLESTVRGEGEIMEHPALARATLLFVPWARMIAADSLAAFAPWLGACLLLHAALLELTARIPVDFRELSLATSAKAAARAQRLRKGGGAAATAASATAARWRIPWLFGRSPMGAIAWRKCAGMARKAKGALWIAILALLFITLVATTIVGAGVEEARIAAPVLIAALGTIYLCSGLRFDFREELERMDVIRAWPLAPGRVFLAMLLPEVVIVSLLVGVTVVVHGALASGLSIYSGAAVALLPFAVFVWVALDNIVFLLVPVRMVPGQDGFVQNAGRRTLQLLLLVLLGTVIASLVGVGFVGAELLAEHLGGTDAMARAAGCVAAVAILFAAAGALVAAGGAVLRRFDVARDRG
jgi:hypothetical protein